MRAADEFEEFERYQRRAEQVGYFEAWREAVSKGYAHGTRDAAAECQGDCLAPIRVKFEHLAAADGRR